MRISCWSCFPVLGVLLVSPLDLRATECRLDLVEVSPVSFRGFICMKFKVVNKGNCYYKVLVSGRAHNPPSGVEYCNCNSSGDPGQMCDCKVTDQMVQVGPYETVTRGSAGRLRVCNPNSTLCDGPCTEAYITDARITCVSADGIRWSSGVDYPMDVCAGECTPRRPCATCMPAWGQPEQYGYGCVPFGDTPACMVDYSNGPVIVSPPQFDLHCVPPQSPSP